jgi:hypothetical protein
MFFFLMDSRSRAAVCSLVLTPRRGRARDFQLTRRSGQYRELAAGCVAATAGAVRLCTRRRARGGARQLNASKRDRGCVLCVNPELCCEPSCMRLQRLPYCERDLQLRRCAIH